MGTVRLSIGVETEESDLEKVAKELVKAVGECAGPGSARSMAHSCVRSRSGKAVEMRAPAAADSQQIVTALAAVSLFRASCHSAIWR